MIRKLLPCLCLTLLCVGVSVAQDREYPKVDFTAAYSLNHITVGTGSQNLNGFTAAVGGNFRKWFAIEGDVTYTTKTFGGLRRSLFTGLVGPRFTARPKDSKLQPFFHTLFGGGHFTGAVNNNGWAGKFGGGLDVVAGKHVAIRVVEIDYYRYRADTLRMNNALFTFGIRVF